MADISGVVTKKKKIKVKNEEQYKNSEFFR